MCKKMIYLIPFVLVLGLALTSTASADITEGLVGHWTFDEGEGTIAYDSSGNGNDGTLHGDPQWVTGMINGALEFDGDGDYVEVPDHETLHQWERFTLAAWIYQFESQSSGMRILDKCTAGTSNGPHMDTYPGRVIRSCSGGCDSTTSEHTLNEWHYVAVTFDAGDKKLYVDGSLEGTGSNTSPLAGNTISLTIGCDSNKANRFNGIIDEARVYNRALTQEEIQQAMKGIPPGSSSNPSPDDDATDVPRDVILNWAPGEFAPALNGHIFYMSESFDDVNDGIGGITQSAASYAPAQRLEFETTYYWRVDEVNAPPDSTVYPGEVWSFTVEPFAYPISAESITATASSSMAGSSPQKTIDGSGLDDSDLHSINLADTWLSDMQGTQPTWIEYQFDKVYKLHEMWVWNQNQIIESAIGYGFKDVSIEYSVDGIAYTTLGTTHEFARGSAAPGYSANTTVDFGDAAVKYVKLTANSNWGGVLAQYGLSEVRFFSIPVFAREPSPASGATDVDVDMPLAWRAGREAAKHEVYLSTDEQAVIDGTAAAVTVTEPSYASSLDLASTYFWRIDEANDAETPAAWQGDVWDFTTQEFIVVDDFELYNDIPVGEEGSNLVYLTWIDGFDNPSVNGSTMGYTVAFEPSLETSIVYDGDQSAPLFYDNTTAGYSEITANVADLQAGQDWSGHGIAALALWFKGDLTHAAANQLYVKINGTKVVYDGDLSTPIWQPFNVDLASSGTNLSNITTLSIGVDGGGSGMLYVDEIALYRIAPPVVEFSPGSDKSLVGHWKLDEASGLTAADSSAFGNDGALTGMTGTEWTAGIRDGALGFDGTAKYVDCGKPKSLQLTGDATISAWVKMEPANQDVYLGIAGKMVANPYDGFALVRHSSNVFRLWVGNLDGSNLTAVSSDVTYNDTDWHRIVGVVNNNTSSLYIDGIKQTEEADVRLADTGDFAYIGKQYSNTDERYWNGVIDDVRIYYRALSGAEILGL